MPTLKKVLKTLSSIVAPTPWTKAEQLAVRKRMGNASWIALTPQQQRGLEALPPPPRFWPPELTPPTAAQLAEGWVRVSPEGLPEAAVPEILPSEIQPHEFLGHIAQGRAVLQWVLRSLRNKTGHTIAHKYTQETILPDFALRLDAAKAAAPYYAARLTKTDLKAVVSLEDLINKSMEAPS